MGVVRNFLLYSFRCVGLVKAISGKVGPAPEKAVMSAAEQSPEKTDKDAEANGTDIYHNLTCSIIPFLILYSIIIYSYASVSCYSMRVINV